MFLGTLTRSQEAAQRAEDLLVDEDRLIGAGKHLGKKLEKHDTNLFAIDSLSCAEEVDILNYVFAQEEF